jgi:hypothetical protein
MSKMSRALVPWPEALALVLIEDEQRLALVPPGRRYWLWFLSDDGGGDDDGGQDVGLGLLAGSVS